MKDLKKADFAETAIEFGKYVQQQWEVVKSFLLLWLKREQCQE